MYFMKIIQEYNKCIGCGNCVALCPKFWEMGEDGKALIKSGKKNQKTGDFELEMKNAAPEDVKCNEEAAFSCPVQIIHVEK